MPVINLKVSHLKMEGMHLLHDLLRGNDFMCKVDLKDTYFCVPLHRNHQTFLRFQRKRKIYKFLCPCFGLDAALRALPKLLKTPIAVLRRIQIRIINYNQNNQNNHVGDESDYKWSRNSQGYIDLSIAGSRLCYKSAEICSGALGKDRVFRVGNRLSENDINTTTRKSKKIETEMPKACFKPQNDTVASE